MTPAARQRLVAESGLSATTVLDWVKGRRACSPVTERRLREACERLGIKPPRRLGGGSQLYALFPDIRIRVTAEERAALIGAAAAEGLPLSVWIRNLACRAIGREPRKVRNTGAGTVEQVGYRRGRRPGATQTLPMACEVCGEPVDFNGAREAQRKGKRTARCVLHKKSGPMAAGGSSK